MPTLPVDGQTGWGDILNAYITALNNSENSTQASLSSHTANSPADPHGDRAYASSLVSPITSGVNGPNGYVKANSSGLIPGNSILPGAFPPGSTSGGILYNYFFDAVAMYGAVPNTGADQAPFIQNALNQCQGLGGIVYIGPGVFSIKSTLHIWDNTLVLMTPGTVIQRIPGTTNAQQMFDNFHTATSHTSNNIVIYGGIIDSYGTSNVTSTCTPLLFVNGYFITVENVRIATYTGTGPAIEVSSCKTVNITRCVFDGYNATGTVSGNFPAVRINNAYTSTMQSQYAAVTSASSPTSMQGLFINGCSMASLISGSNNGPVYQYFAGSDLGDASHIIQVNKMMISSNWSLYGSSSQLPIDQPSATTNWTSYNLTDNEFFSYNTGAWSNATLPSGWSGVLRYKLGADNEVVVDCLITTGTSPGAGNFTLFNLSNNLTPNNNLYWAIAVTQSGITQPSYGFTSGSSVQVNIPANTTRISFNQHIPLD